MSESEVTGTGPTPSERAEIAAQSLHSAELEGHAVTAATQRDTTAYVAGEITAQEMQHRVRDRYGVRSEGESEQSSAFTSVNAAAHAFAAGRLSEDEFIAAVVSLPVVRQTPMPDHWFDDWARVDGPLFDLGEAFTQGLISAQLHDDAGRAMLLGGHSA